MDIDCCNNVRISNCTVNLPWDNYLFEVDLYARREKEYGERHYRRLHGKRLLQVGHGARRQYRTFDLTARRRPPFHWRIKCGAEPVGGSQRITTSNYVFFSCEGTLENLTPGEFDSKPSPPLPGNYPEPTLFRLFPFRPAVPRFGR
jgi:hypothetical protein